MVTSGWGPWEGAEPGNDRWCPQTSDGSKGAGDQSKGADHPSRRPQTGGRSESPYPGIDRRVMTNGDIRLVRGRALTPAMTDAALRPAMGRRVWAISQRVRATHSQRPRPGVGQRAPTPAMTDGALRPGAGQRAPTPATADGALRQGHTPQYQGTQMLVVSG
jgi:hypothetical protein